MLNLGRLALAWHQRRIFSLIPPSLPIWQQELYLETRSWPSLKCAETGESYHGEWVCRIRWKHVYFNISVLFIVGTTSTLKLLFPITYCFCLDSHLSGCVFSWLLLLLFPHFFYYSNRYSFLSYHGYHQYSCFCYACHVSL